MSADSNKSKIVKEISIKTIKRTDETLDFMSSMSDTSGFSSDDQEQGDRPPLRKKPKINCEEVFLGPALGSGAFSTVYAARYKSRIIALKIEESDDQKNALKPELKFYRKLKPHAGLPKIFGYGYTSLGRNSVLLMELLGPSLGYLLKKCVGTFSLKTVCMIGLQMLELLEYIHSQDIIHRDIKPENCMVGRGTRRTMIYLADFGLASTYIDKKTKKHRPFVNRGHAGTLQYMSVNCHANLEQSRRDDLESLFYMLIEFLKGHLPWDDEDASTSSMVNINLRKIKLDLPMLCKNIPNEITICMEQIRSLDFEETPDYNMLRDQLNAIMERHQFKRDNVFDWQENYKETNYEDLITLDEKSAHNLTLTHQAL